MHCEAFFHSAFCFIMRNKCSEINTNNIKVCQKWLWFLNYIKEKITEDDKED